MTHFWNGKRVFITCPTGFLGAWLVQTLLDSGSQVFGFGEPASTSPNLFDLKNLGQKISMTYGDMRDESALREALQFAQADVVLHLGESGLISDLGKRPLETFAKAALGTATLMELMRETASVRSLVVVSSDKVYARKSSGVDLAETDAVAPSAILPTAKLCAEMIALSYRQSFFAPEKYNKHKIAVATARMGSAIGGGDFTEHALVPQAVQAFVAGNSFDLKNPQSVRPWIHVQDQVAGLMCLAEALYERGPKLAPTYNFAAKDTSTVGEVAQALAVAWGENAQVNLGEGSKSSLSVHANLDSKLAQSDLNWKVQRNLTDALKETIHWYKEFYSSRTSATL